MLCIERDCLCCVADAANPQLSMPDIAAHFERRLSYAAGSQCALPAAPRPLPCSSAQLRGGVRLQAVRQRQQRRHVSGSTAVPAAAAWATAGEPAGPAWGPAQLLARAVALAVSVWRSMLTRLAAGVTPSQPLDSEVSISAAALDHHVVVCAIAYKPINSGIVTISL